MVRKRINTLATISSLVLLGASGATAVTVPLESLTLSIPSDPINVLSIKLVAGLLGSDSEKTNLSGTLMAALDLDISSGRPVPTGITLNGGRVEASDVTFQFLRGAIAVELSDLAAFPTTPSPPGTVMDDQFDATQHEIIINEGTIRAVGNTFNLFQDPISTDGEGFGTIRLTEVAPADGDLLTYDVNLSLPIMGTDTFVIENVPLVGSFSVDVSISGIVEAVDRINLSIPSPQMLQAGDANQDLSFDQLDIVQVSAAGKFLSGQNATWGEGDWDGAPGGSQGSPPTGNGFFDQLDIVSSLGPSHYLTGPYAALNPDGQPDDGQTSVGYNPHTGEIFVDAPAGMELTSLNIDSAAAVFTGDPAQNLGGSFDNDANNNIFKATFGGSFGSLSFGNVAQPGLAKDFLLGDLSVVGSLAGGGPLGAVDLIYVPEPSSALLLAVGILAVAACRRIKRRPCRGSM